MSESDPLWWLYPTWILIILPLYGISLWHYLDRKFNQRGHRKQP